MIEDGLQVVGQGLASEQEGLRGLEDVRHHHVEQHARRQGEEQEHAGDHHGRDLVGRGLLWVGRHAHAREDLAHEQACAEGGHQDCDIPVDGAIGVEAHLAEGLDEQEAAAGCQTGDLGFHGHITGGDGMDAAVLIHAHQAFTLGDAPGGGEGAAVLHTGEH